MPKTRLTIADRRDIAAQVLAHKFDPIMSALLAEENGLAEEARRVACGDMIKVMDKAKVGVFKDDVDFEVNVSGARINLRFGGSKHADAVRRRIFYCHNNYDGRFTLLEDSDLGGRIRHWADRNEAQKASQGELKTQTEATLASFNTFDDLLTAWPQAEKFIKARWQSRPEWTANVPAVALNDLAAKLDLPPELQAAA